MSSYPFETIEAKWRKIWQERGDYKIDLNSPKDKFYCLVMFSYPSALKLHIGHWYNFAPTDTFARLKRMEGYNVFEPMGFDAFGLPAENYAVKRGVHPGVTTEENVNFIREQLELIGAMYDWGREVNTSKPEYYKWTQWLFLFLFKRGLAYQKQAPVNWCPECQTVLANEQVIGEGECERCGSAVTKKDLKQWFFRITDYAERLLEGLNRLDWPKKSIIQQSNWIGRSEGANIKFPVVGGEESIEVFTTRADTLFGVTHLVLAPEHPLTLKLAASDRRQAVEEYVNIARQATDIERQSLGREKTGVFIGAYALNPINEEKVEVWAADYVLATYGTGAVMAVPGHDQRDFEFARKYGMGIKVVIQNREGSLKAEKMEEAYTEYGIMVNSGEFNGMDSKEGMLAVADKLAAIGQGGRSVTYHLHDWLISRQRYWGAPIPIIHCERCGAVPVPEKDLPVMLPGGEIDFKPKGKSPLAALSEYMNTVCPRCRGGAKRDADTMDTFVCSSWYFFRYLCTEIRDKIFNSEVVNRWMPVDQYVGGTEHINGHLLYSRFITKALFDAGLIEFDEPFSSLRHQGVITSGGWKMSKSKGNVVNPEEFIERYGSDVFRLYMMFMGDYEVGGDWSDEGIIGVARFVNRIWRLYEDYWPVNYGWEAGSGKHKAESEERELERILHSSIKSVREDINDFKFNTAIARVMELVNAIYGYVGITKRSELNGKLMKQVLATLPLIIAPLAPHLGEELWEKVQGGLTETVFDQSWPAYDEQALASETVEIAIQVNGKVRATLKMRKGAPEGEAAAEAYKLDNVQRHIGERTIVKKIYIQDKILNIVVK